LKIETLVNLVGGELLNSPYISEVTSYTKNVDEVVRGSCFFVENESDIPKAVKNGAYAIVSEKYENIIDNEIAWIKVESIQKAITDIFKYENLQTTIYFCDEITEHIVSKMNLDNNLIILKSYDDLLYSLNFSKILLTSKQIFKELFSNIKDIKQKDIPLKQDGLFYCIYNNQKIFLPYVYKSEFSKALNFFEENSLKYTLEFELDRFKPVFVNYKLQEVNFGESERVLIKGIKNDTFFFKELNYFIQNTKHAKSVVVNENIKELLNVPFNFAMLVDFDIKITKSENQGSLF